MFSVVSRINRKKEKIFRYQVSYTVTLIPFLSHEKQNIIVINTPQQSNWPGQAHDYFFFNVLFSFREESEGNYSKQEHRTRQTLFAITYVDHSKYTHTRAHTGTLINSLYTDMSYYLQDEKKATVVLV